MSTDSGNVDQLFEVLSHQYRRHILATLSWHSSTETPQKDLRTLSETLATNRDTKEIRIQLVHCHLPKLERYGFVEWDRKAETVAKGPKWATVEPFLDVLISHDPELVSNRA